MKKPKFILLIILLAVVFAGKGKNISITDRALVHAVGIDKSDNGVKVTLQIFKPEAAGADTPIDISRANFKAVSAEGKTAEECLSRLSAQVGKDLFFGHLQLIVIGLGTEFESIDDIMGPFMNDTTVYQGLYLACADDAGEAVSLPIKENAVTAENYKGLIETAAKGGYTLTARLFDLSAVYKESGAAALSYLTIKGESEDRELFADGAYILSEHGFDDKKIPHDDCAVLGLIINKEAGGRFTPEDDEKNAQSIVLTDRRHSVDTKGGKLKIKITLTAEAEGGNTGKLSAELESRAEELISEYLLKQRRDIFGLFRQIRFYEPSIYTEYSDRLYSLYGEADIDVRLELITDS